jgi:cytochrome c biogenesis factor
LAVPTRSNNGGPPRSGSAWLAVFVGLLSLAALPAAIVATRWSKAYELIDSAAAIPVAILLGIVAILLARRVRTRGLRTLSGVRGSRPARLGRVLGVTGLLLGVTGAMSVGVFLILSAVD